MAPPMLAERAPQLALLLELRDLATQAADLPLDREGAPALTAPAGALRRMMERTIAILGALQRLDEIDEVPAADDDDDDAWMTGGATSSRPYSQVGDVCFAGTLELTRVLRELIAAPAGDDLVIATETAHRKLRRAIRAVLEAAREAGGTDILGGEHKGRHRVADLDSALAVRRLYATFRRALRAPTDDSPEAVLAAVRYAGGALAALVTEPDYADVRASDRAVLRALRERALTWARGDRAVLTGQQLLADVETCADLLRGINRRQELRAHDLELITALCADRSGAPSWWTQLEALVGLDDVLDAVLAEARITDDGATLAARAIARLEQLQ